MDRAQRPGSGSRSPSAGFEERALRKIIPFPVVALLLACGPTGSMGAEELPPGVEQILPRGGIPAVVEPRFVAAAEAEIPDDAWVLGVVVDGRSRAYSLNLLNHHEVVNDRVGEVSFAAVW